MTDTVQDTWGTSDEVRSGHGTIRTLLPEALYDLPVARLRLENAVVHRLQDAGWLTVGDALSSADSADIHEDDIQCLRTAMAAALRDGTRQFDDIDATDWPTLKAQLLGPLDKEARRLLSAAIGIDGPAMSRTAQRNLLADGTLDEHLQAIRGTLMQHSLGLMQRLRDETENEFEAFDGILIASHAAKGSLIARLGSVSGTPELGLRLAAFCLPHMCHMHRGILHSVQPRRFRALLRALPQLVPQHRLPLSIESIATMLEERGVAVPRGVLLHVLRTEVHVRIEIEDERGEIAVPDPRKPAARLAELMIELGQPTPLSDLVFAYRERFRFASQLRLRQHLADHGAFLQLGPELWSMRAWHEEDLSDALNLSESVARRISTSDERQDVHLLVREEQPDADERASWLVLAILADDPRVRLLGRGTACAADGTQSSVMRRLLQAFRRAGGDVVEGLFVQNQPREQRRLVERLLEHNRAFVKPEPDRIDVLTNYPFNTERMQQLIKLVVEHLQERAGYAHVEALKDAVDKIELGGRWLTPQLLGDILKRNGPFELLEPGIIALKSLALTSTLRRSARCALRELGRAVTIPEIVRHRSDLAEFRPCLAHLLVRDALVQSPDGVYFVLA
ncbi:MAG: hypothetical protein AB8H80_04925 [Planctomycetota bacterium]